jgi:hypothetical protein
VRNEENHALFTEEDLRHSLDSHFERIQEFVDEISKVKFVAASDDELYQHVYDTFVVTPIEIDESQITMDLPEPVKVDVRGRAGYFHVGNGPALVPGLRLKVWIPYSGDDRLWTLRPHSLWSTGAVGNVHASNDGASGQLGFILTHPTGESAEEIRGVINQMLHPIREALKAQKGEIDWRVAKLPDLIRAAIDSRRKDFEKHDNIVRTLAIPLRHKPGVPPVNPIHVRRRFPKPLPAAPAAVPEPGIPDEEYEYILNILRHVGCTFEATPATYRVHDEEELRDILLANLNSHYLGDATGETFRKQGRTDIRIEAASRSAFVAECKVWRGVGELAEAIEQLQRYLTWRDSKAAVVVFNKKVAGFSELQVKVPELFRTHPLFRAEIRLPQAGEWRFVLASTEDPNRRLTVHVFLFNLYVAE